MVEDEGGEAEAVGDVVAGMFVRDERARGLAWWGQFRAARPEGPNCAAEQADEQREDREREHDEHGQAERRWRAAVRMDRVGAAALVLGMAGFAGAFHDVRDRAVASPYARLLVDLGVSSGPAEPSQPAR
ncbi:hypothetical protein [Nannocystis pusilla]|uniref:hypothetical protein n=1 Tax=Nannocystis pusilla TaxID=889268 RepID=UPI003BF11786